MAAARSRLAIALAALGVAFAACFGGDHGAARAAVGNPTGPLIGSPVAGAAILTAKGMAPATCARATSTVSNVGDESGDFAVGATGLADVGAPLGAASSTSTSRTSPPAPRRARCTAGKLSGMSSVGLGAIAQGSARHYRFTISLPAGADDSFQGATSTVTFLWTATGAGEHRRAAHRRDRRGAGTAGRRADAGAGHDGRGTAGGEGRGQGRAPRRLAQRPRRQKAKPAWWPPPSPARPPAAWTLSGTTTVAAPELKLGRRQRKVLARAGRARMKVRLPAKARLALAARRPVTVRLTMKATVGSRVVTVKRTVRIKPAAR